MSLQGLGKFDVEIEILINSQCPQAQHPILACRSMFIIYGSRHASTTCTAGGAEHEDAGALVPSIQSCRTSRETHKDAARHSTCYSQCYTVSLLDLRVEIWQNQVTTTSAGDWSSVFSIGQNPYHQIWQQPPDDNHEHEWFRFDQIHIHEIAFNGPLQSKVCRSMDVSEKNSGTYSMDGIYGWGTRVRYPW